ncbi:hypothetical protein ACFP1H_06545 [Secundilactobacillus hailunensis]|uniref:ABC transporter permease n=1 Tax=Secundilactobacillus hailunensis TaxID=2559923 RepID=A0ABW1T910_9LACO|nr:hypothetical protein [Secundilactobacillus hailunensis]
MTKFTALVPALLRDRFKSINRIIVLFLVVVVVNGVMLAIQNGVANLGTGLMGAIGFWSSLAFLIVFIRMAMYNESVYQSDAIRLIPTSDTKIYLGSLSATVIGMLYFGVVQAVINAIVAFASGNWSNYFMSSDGGLSTMKIIEIVLMTLLIFVASIVMVWTTISLIHLIILSIGAFLPIGRQRLIRGILYIVVSLAIIRTAVGVFHIYGMVMSGLSVGWGTAFASLGAIVLVAVLESVANVLLMNKFVETAQ